MGKSLLLKIDDIESNTISNKSKVSVYDEPIREYEQSILEGLEKYLRLLRIEKDINFIPQK